MTEHNDEQFEHRFEQRIRRGLHGLDDLPTPTVTDTRTRAARFVEQHDARSDFRRRVGVIGGTVVVVAAGLTGLVWARGGDPTFGPVAAPVSSTTPTIAPATTGPTDTGASDPIAEPTQTMPMNPTTTNRLPARTVPPPTVPAGWADVWGTVSAPDLIASANLDPSVAVWTGTEAIVIGPNDELIDTAVGASVAYDPAADSWHPLARPPTATAGDEIAVWTGTEMLLLGGSENVSLAYDPSTDAWRELTDGYGVMPMGHMLGGERGMPYAWTGAELLVWSEVGDGANIQGLHAYDPTTDKWRAIATPPEGFYRRRAAATVWTGTEWLLWGGTGRNADGANTEYANGAAYNPATDTWRMLAESPLQERRAAATWTGIEMLIIAGSSGGDVTGNGEMAHADAAAYDPAADTWRPLTPGVAHPGLQPVWTGEYAVIFYKGTAGVYHPASDTWIDTCCNNRAGAGRTHVWTGVSVISFNGYDSRYGGTTFTPPE